MYKIRQALIAQAAGADYVAPYLGRIADGIRATYPQVNPTETFDDMTPEDYQYELNKAAMESAVDAVAAMQAAVTATGSQMRVLVASIRSASDMATLAARVSVAQAWSDCQSQHMAGIRSGAAQLRLALQSNVPQCAYVSRKPCCCHEHCMGPTDGLNMFPACASQR